MRARPLAIFATASVALASCYVGEAATTAQAPPHVTSVEATEIAPGPPPPDQLEMPGLVTSTDLFWMHGRWHWLDGRWVWVTGHWEHVRAGYGWVPGRWMQRRDGWVWAPGFFQRS